MRLTTCSLCPVVPLLTDSSSFQIVRGFPFPDNEVSGPSPRMNFPYFPLKNYRKPIHLVQRLTMPQRHLPEGGTLTSSSAPLMVFTRLPVPGHWLQQHVHGHHLTYHSPYFCSVALSSDLQGGNVGTPKCDSNNN